MRLFVGIELPDSVREEVAAIAEHYRSSIHRIAGGAAIRWVEPANLHLTLLFLGETDDGRAAAVVAALQKPFEMPAFAVGLRGAGAFPPSGGPRVLWLGVDRGRLELIRLQAEVSGRLTPLGYEPEARAYSPHLTMARVKDMRRADAAAVRRLLEKGTPPPSEFALAAVTLFRSRLSPHGARYEPLLRVPLR